MKGLGFLTALFATMFAAALAQSPPPADLHLEGDHWTAWQLPAREAGTETYVIQGGDTLWGLASRFLGNPHLWPQIWEQNQYILDAHWIYPGDTLFVPGAAGKGAQLADASGVAGPPLEQAEAAAAAGGTLEASSEASSEATSEMTEDAAETAAVVAPDSAFLKPTGAPVPIGYESDIYCSGYIGELAEEFPYRIVGSEYEFLAPTLDPQRTSEIKGLWGKTDTQKYGLGVGDIIYTDGGRTAGLAAGEILTAVQPRQKVIHPLTHEVMGRLYSYLGRIRVLSVQENMAIAEILHSCDALQVGVALKLFEPEPVPLRRITTMRPANYPPPIEALDNSATIIMARDSIVALGEGHLVYIDRGFEDEVAPGDIFTVYRRGRRGFPPVVMGELGVLSVAKKSALARILRSRYTIFIGDALLLK